MRFILVPLWIPNISANARWIQNGVTVAGGNGWGNELNQLARPLCIYVDNDQTVYVSDHFNHRIVEWKNGSTDGRVVAGGNGQGNQNNQLDGPLKMIIDEVTDSLIICDYYNKRVVRWSRQNVTNGEVIISNIACSSTIMDNDGYLYVADHEKQHVERWKIGDINGTIVAGGDRLNQLSYPLYIFVDQDHSVYISDRGNHCVMKWLKGAKQGIVVAGGQDRGDSLTQLSNPHGIVVDQLGTIYVADYDNHRVMRWFKGATEGSVVVGANQLDSPCDLSFDRENNLYVLDFSNQRVQKFSFDWFYLL
jgi:sugar lactone lactonase YvrE